MDNCCQQNYDEYVCVSGCNSWHYVYIYRTGGEQIRIGVAQFNVGAGNNRKGTSDSHCRTLNFFN